MAWPQRGLLIGVIATALVFATRPMPMGVATSSRVLWAAFVLNALLLLVLGSIALSTTSRWFRQDLPFEELRRQRRAAPRRAVFLGVIVFVAHQTLVVQLDPRFSLDRLTGRRRVFGPAVAVPDRLELAWAFTAVALGYIILAWLLWRNTAVADLLQNDTQPTGSLPVLDVPPPPRVAAARVDAVEALPRDPVTGRVVRQFDL